MEDRVLSSRGVVIASPTMSLRAADAIDDRVPPPPFDVRLDLPTPDYLERYSGGVPHLDAASWRYYLPHFLQHCDDHLTNPASNAVMAILFSLRPPDRDPPRFGTLTDQQVSSVVAVLDRLAFTETSEWKEEAAIALEEYWAPGANYP